MKMAVRESCFVLLVFIILITSLAFTGCNKNNVANEKVEPTCAVDENNPFDEATGTLYFSDEMLEEIGKPSYLKKYKCDSYEINEHYFLNRNKFEKQVMKAKTFVVSKDNPTFYTRDGVLYRKENNELAFCPPAYEGEIYIGADVNSINYRAFERCFNITRFVVDANNEKYMDKDGILYSKDESILYAYPAKRQGELVISPATQKVSAVLCCALCFLEKEAYSNNKESHGLKKIVIENRDTELYFIDYTFFDCPNLKEVQYNFSESKYYKLITVDNEGLLMRETVKENFVE